VTLADHLARKLEAFWPDALSRQRVRTELDRYGLAPHEREADRVLLAIIKLSAGDERKIADLLIAAKRDYRDILLWAEYPTEANTLWSLHPNLTDDEQTRLDDIRRQDRRQYLAWLEQ
jgi:hypothetical protein